MLAWLRQGECVGRLSRDNASINFARGYIESEKVPELIDANVEIVCKPWRQQNGDKFNKTDFVLDFGEGTVICPAGQEQLLVLGQIERFDPQTRDACSLKSRCTTSERGQSLHVAEDEPLQAELRACTDCGTPTGLASGGSARNIQELMGHEDLKTSAIYIHQMRARRTPRSRS